MRPAALFLASFLAISTSAQLPIPLALLAERPVASAEVKPAAFEGRSSVASNGLTFLVATTQDGFFGYATRNGFMVVDAEGRPLLEASS